MSNGTPDPIAAILAAADAMAQASDAARAFNTLAAQEEIEPPPDLLPQPKPKRAHKPKLSLVEVDGSNAPPCDPPEPVPPPFSEDAIAARMVLLYGQDWRYAPKRGLWLRWDGYHWQEEELPVMADLAKHVCREVVNFDQGVLLPEGQKRTLCSAKTHNAVVKITGYDTAICTRESQWDVDKLALATPGGVVDLRTGELRPAKREDYMSQITSVAPSPTPDCPLWRAFLATVTAGDATLEDYLQRLAGYSLTGLTTEHVFAFFYGTGANGKSVFLKTIAAIMQDYTKQADIATFTESQNDRHTTEIARLQKARLVISQETEASKKLSESKIKTMTGGDKLTARFMRQDDFEYTPIFKLILAGNHRPGLNDVGEAMRRRVHIVPWAVTIPQDERDTHLEEKLRAEHPGILRWMIEGCLAWRQMGLMPPASVTSATDEYLEAEDALRGWMDECIEVNPLGSVPIGTIYTNYVEFCERNKEHPWGKKRLLQTLTSREGITPEREFGVKVLKGLLLADGPVQGALM